MRQTLGVVVAACLVASVALATSKKKKAPSWWHSKVTVENKSHYAIHHFFLSPAHDTHWGEDLLGTDILEPGETLEVKKIECDSYDLKLEDEDGDDCIVEDIDLCLEDADWELTDKDLLSCQGWK